MYTESKVTRLCSRSMFIVNKVLALVISLILMASVTHMRSWLSFVISIFIVARVLMTGCRDMIVSPPFVY